MATSHLINIIRQIVNAWATLEGVSPVFVKEYWAEMDFTDRHKLERYSIHSRMFLREIYRRLETGEQLPPGYERVWQSVVDKVSEMLQRRLQPAS